MGAWRTLFSDCYTSPVRETPRQRGARMLDAVADTMPYSMIPPLRPQGNTQPWSVLERSSSEHVEQKLVLRNPEIPGSSPTPAHFNLDDHHSGTCSFNHYCMTHVEDPNLVAVLHWPNCWSTVKRLITSLRGWPPSGCLNIYTTQFFLQRRPVRKWVNLYLLLCLNAVIIISHVCYRARHS